MASVTCRLTAQHQNQLWNPALDFLYRRMLLVLALEIMDEDARPLGLTINWSKTKIQTMLDPAPVGNQVTINGHSVEVVESLPYLGSLVRYTGDSIPEIKRRVSITRDCMIALDRNIWRSRISVSTK